LYLAVVVLAALSVGWATGTGAVAAGVLKERETALYRGVFISWTVALIVRFFLFVGTVWLLRWVTRRPHVGLGALTRLLSLSLAPSCLLVIAGVAEFYPDDLVAPVTVWACAIAIVGLRVGGGASWLNAVVVALLAYRFAGPVAEIADLIMSGIH